MRKLVIFTTGVYNRVYERNKTNTRYVPVTEKIQVYGVYVSCLLEEGYTWTVCMYRVCERKDTTVRYVCIVSVRGKIQQYCMYVSCL